MLILTRKVGQSLVINGDTEVKVLGITGLQVRLGIEAPDDVSVDRQEVHERKQADHAADQEVRDGEVMQLPWPSLSLKQAD
ncbi:MAG: carbon storage regulator CsrA [Sulfuricaulis sp.]